MSRPKKRYKTHPWLRDILERDNYTCCECKATSQDITIIVYHIDQTRDSVTGERNNSPDNLTSLCKRCLGLKAHSPDKDRIAKIISMHDSGMSYQKIADEMGISQQRIHILYSEWKGRL